ncbi:MAG: diacylglycerol kinase family lipid kinase [Actinomycetota bacterium]|nr:diacylglycerol kinase family lipid kinase [Actinomycetota bacterium]
MRRLVLVANHNAQTVNPYRREVISTALRSQFDVELIATKGRGHATEVARRAVQEGVDVVAAFGGDGTVNEVTNGLASSRVPLAILPGGMANVFARSLGIPHDPVEATGFLLEKSDDAPRRVPLGRLDDRYFTANAGVGLDAAVVREVERRPKKKKVVGDWFFAWTAVRVLVTRPRLGVPKLRIRWGDDPKNVRDRMAVAVFQNTSPYTFLRGRAMNVCPEATVDGGIDCLSIDTERSSTIIRIALSTFGRARHTKSRHVLYLHDQRSIRVLSEAPRPVHVDGEYVGERQDVLVESVPDAMSVIC